MTSSKPGRDSFGNSITEQKTVNSLEHGEINKQ